MAPITSVAPGTDGAGDIGVGPGSISTATVTLDTTAPVITYSGNLGSYAADQIVNITCTANDSLSGVASITPVPA